VPGVCRTSLPHFVSTEAADAGQPAEMSPSGPDLARRCRMWRTASTPIAPISEPPPTSA